MRPAKRRPCIETRACIAPAMSSYSTMTCRRYVKEVVTQRLVQALRGPARFPGTAHSSIFRVLGKKRSGEATPPQSSRVPALDTSAEPAGATDCYRFRRFQRYLSCSTFSHAPCRRQAGRGRRPAPGAGRRHCAPAPQQAAPHQLRHNQRAQELHGVCNAPERHNECALTAAGGRKQCVGPLVQVQRVSEKQDKENQNKEHNKDQREEQIRGRVCAPSRICRTRRACPPRSRCTPLRPPARLL